MAEFYPSEDIKCIALWLHDLVETRRPLIMASASPTTRHRMLVVSASNTDQLHLWSPLELERYIEQMLSDVHNIQNELRLAGPICFAKLVESFESMIEKAKSDFKAFAEPDLPPLTGAHESPLFGGDAIDYYKPAKDAEDSVRIYANMCSRSANFLGELWSRECKHKITNLESIATARVVMSLLRKFRAAHQWLHAMTHDLPKRQKQDDSQSASAAASTGDAPHTPGSNASDQRKAKGGRPRGDGSGRRGRPSKRPAVAENQCEA